MSLKIEQRKINEEAAYAGIARKDFERKCYAECDKEDEALWQDAKREMFGDDAGLLDDDIGDN